MTDVVLIHGGAHGSWCWQRVEPLIEARTVAIDLPGRGIPDPAMPLNRMTLEDWVSSAVRDIESRATGDLVLVGQSMAGLTVPGIECPTGLRGGCATWSSWRRASRRTARA